ncbi:MAG: hypothetical protein Q7S40_15215 [Opitutaceae bacterium]|nr:hypothetical protein [Opitutaceae bacterium]
MSKGSKKSGRKTQPAPTPAAGTSVPAPSATPAPAAAGASATTADTGSSWLDSSDPRRRTMGKIVLAAVWIYVAALWLLALDQTFSWGIFGPKVPPIP